MMNNTTNTSNKIAQTIDRIERSSILDELKTQARWLPYRMVDRDVRAINSENGNVVYPEDTSNWRTFEDAKEEAKLACADGLGFVFGDKYFCITLNTDFSNFYDSFAETMSQFKLFLNSYTEWSENGKLKVFCKVQEDFYNTNTLYGSSIEISNGSIQTDNTNKYCFVPVSGVSYGNPVPITELTGKVTYLYELSELLHEDYRNCLQLRYSDFRSAFKDAAEIFIFMCDNKCIKLRLKNNRIHLVVDSSYQHKQDKEFFQFMRSLLNASRYFQVAIVRELYDEQAWCGYHFRDPDDQSTFIKLSNSLCKQHLPCYPYDVALALIFGVDKYQLYR